MIGADGGRHPVKESSASRGGDLAGIRAGRGDRVPADRWQSLEKQHAETRDVRQIAHRHKRLAGSREGLPAVRVLTAIEDLIDAGTIELIMPQIVLDEFARNRDRVVEQSRRSFSSHIKRVQEAVTEFGEEDRRAATLQELSKVEHKIAMKG